MIFLKNSTEKKIVHGCLMNDRRFQKELFEKYKDAMYTVVFRILRKEQLADDALQEGFVQVFTSMQNYRFEASLGSWIKTIMIRCALKILKQEPLRLESEENAMNISIEWDANLTGELLDKAIAQLSPGYRSIFLLIEVEGYSHKEVSEMLNISEGTSKSQLSRAKIILQKKLQYLRY
jgi:RNA polymerase sigma factor (sigma-70 family)